MVEGWSYKRTKRWMDVSRMTPSWPRVCEEEGPGQRVLGLVVQQEGGISQLGLQGVQHVGQMAPEKDGEGVQGTRPGWFGGVPTYPPTNLPTHPPSIRVRAKPT